MGQGPDGPLIWVDMEMTGLDPENDAIIEFAALATDASLKETHRFGEYIVFQPAARFELMDDWNKKHHVGSGLWQKVIESQLTTSELETKFLDWLQSITPPKTSPLCGNSIWQDRRFITRYMPKVDQYLHYRTVDVSTVKELARRWYPDSKYEKTGQHRAMGDILESIEELRFYKQKFFVAQ